MANELVHILSQLDQTMEKLKVRYDHYFMGLERFAPIKDRRAVERTIRSLQSQIVGNTAQKFKLRMLIQRFISYKTHWDRIQREIDEGRHRRDLAKIQRDLKKRGVDAKDLLKARTASEVEAALMKYILQAKEKEAQAHVEQKSALAAVKPTPPEKAVGDKEAKISTPPPIPAEAMKSPKAAQDTSNDARLKNLYQAYIAARKKTGQSIKGVSYEKMVKSINKQLPAIQKKHGSNKVEFCVVVQNGKAILKAVTKK